MGTRGGRPSLEGNPVMVVVTVLFAVAVLVFSAYVVTTFPPDAPLPDAAAADGPASTSATSTAPDEPEQPGGTSRQGSKGAGSGDDAPAVAVLGDAYTAGSPEGGLGDKAWPVLLEERTGAETTAYAEAATGYVVGPDDSFEDRAGAMLRDWDGGDAGDAVIVFGGRSDAAEDPAVVEAAAERTLGFLARSVPDAEIICVGPVWPTQAPPGGGEAVREAVRTAAQSAGVTYVDPQAEPWFSAENPDTIGAGLVVPTNLGHGYLAGKMRTVLADAGILDPA